MNSMDSGKIKNSSFGRNIAIVATVCLELYNDINLVDGIIHQAYCAVAYACSSEW